MIEEDLKSSKVSVKEMECTLMNCQVQIDRMILLITEYLKSYRKLIENLTNGWTEKVATKVYTVSPLATFVHKTVGLLHRIRSEHIRKVDAVLKEIVDKRSIIGYICSDCVGALRKLLASLKAVKALYKKEYKGSINSLEKIKQEVQELETQCIVNAKDSFMQYVISAQRRSRKRIRKLKALECTVKEKLNTTIEDINLTLDKVNKDQMDIPTVYGNALSKVLKIFAEVLDMLPTFDNSSAISLLAPLQDEAGKILSLDKAKFVDRMTAAGPLLIKEDCGLSKFTCRFVTEFSECCQDIYSDLASYLKKYEEKSKDSDNACKIAILKEWEELLEMYIKGKIGFNKKLCLYIDATMKNKLESAAEVLCTNKKLIKESQQPLATIKAFEFKNLGMVQQICDSLNGLFQYLSTTLEQSVLQSKEYLKLVNIASSDVSLVETVKLKYISLADSGDTSTVTPEDPGEDPPLSPQRPGGGLGKKFGVSEEAIDSFVCAVSWKILLQGRLYITKSFLCFSSPFNNSTIFGHGTKIVIPYYDIIKVKTALNALIFDNSISIQTASATFFFTSFVYRDKAYDLIKRLYKEFKNGEGSHLDIRPSIVPQLLGSIKENSMNSSRLNSSMNVENNVFLEKIEAEEKKRLEAAKKEGLKLPISSPLLEQTYPCPIQILLSALLNKKHPIARKLFELGDNKELFIESQSTPLEYFVKYKYALGEIMKSEQKDKDQFLDTMSKWPISHNVKMNYTHIMKDAPPIPFFPKEFKVYEDSKPYYLSPNHVIIEAKITGEGLPYADYFITRQYMELIQNLEKDKYKTTLKVFVEIEFLKTTMLKGTIEKTGIDGANKILYNVTKPILEEYVSKEMLKFEKMLESKNAGKDGIVNWTPKIENPVISQLIFKEFRKNAFNARELNRVIANQKKIFVIIMVMFVVLLLLTYLRQYYAMLPTLNLNTELTDKLKR
eukprot:TRINITY_DN2043_c0_g1_i1.p1 TRINITY_DN2043_c0_g1~~TRINITY_DN2043_c0_g1_i1.p1  ORF type:complete len:996 (+),score=116.43 TRINITY_DN2043_c0_g1_i1:134-2989(+)